MNQLAILISEFLTVLVVGLSFAVVILWMPGNPNRDEAVNQNESVRYLVTGIVLSFCASIGDNVWWGIAWGLRVENRPEWQWWFDNGVYANIVFRQGMKCIAAWCHIKAATSAGIIQLSSAKEWFLICSLLGFALTGLLLLN